MILPTAPKRVLGVAIDEKSIRLAELHVGRTGVRVASAQVWPLPADASWDRPAELGQKLAQFLRDKGFAARHAAVGLPGRWVLAKARQIPPAPAATAGDILRLALERQFHADAREWAFDYAGATSPRETSTVLLAATPSQKLNQVLAALAAANLRVLSVTSTTLALADASPDAPAGAVLHLSSDGAELALRQDGRVVGIERLTAAPAPGSAAIAGEVRRNLTAHTRPAAAAPDLTIWDTAGLDPKTATELASQLRVTSRLNPDLGKLGVLNGSASAHQQSPATAGAVVLAAGGIARKRPAIDFLHSRLAVKKQRRFSRVQVGAALAVAAVLLIILALAGDWYLQDLAVQDIQKQLATLKATPPIPANAAPNTPKPLSTLETARRTLTRYTFGRGWYDTRPPLLECTRALTAAFPTNGGVWATSLTVRDDLTGTLVGKADDGRSALEMLDRLRASKRFADPKLLYLRQEDRGGRAVSFAATFTYIYKAPE